MLPFLKNRDDDGVGVGPSESIKRKPDEDKEMDMLDAVCQDMLLAIDKHDKALLKSALSSLCQHIQYLDEEQDQNISGV